MRLKLSAPVTFQELSFAAGEVNVSEAVAERLERWLANQDEPPAEMEYLGEDAAPVAPPQPTQLPANGTTKSAPAPKRQMSEAQLAALAKARENQAARRAAAQSAAATPAPAEEEAV
jgi:hypothetical protein